MSILSNSISKYKNVTKSSRIPEGWFTFVDTDGNGQLSLKEAIDGLVSQLPLDYDRIEQDVQSLWSKWDKDHNGLLSKSEFLDQRTGMISYLLNYYSKTEPDLQPPSIKANNIEWFHFWDQNNSNSLEKSEIIRALIKTFRLDGRETTNIADIIDNIWVLFDTDGSGSIEIDEFVAPDNLADTILAQLLT